MDLNELNKSLKEKIIANCATFVAIGGGGRKRLSFADIHVLFLF